MGQRGIWMLAAMAAVIGAAIVAGLAGLARGGAEATDLTATFTATEDTFVREARPDENYGDRLRLQVEGYPGVKRTLMRFHVSGLPEGATVKSATLRLFVVNSSDHGGSVHSVEGDWSEATTTWSNAPSLGTKVAEVYSPASAGTWIEADVTAAVASSGDVDFYLVTASTDAVYYSSSEGRLSPPTLTVQWSVTSPSPAPTQTPAVSIKSVTILVDEGAGRVDWSHARDLLAFDRLGDDGYYDIWTMQPDGSEQVCLTCDSLELPGKHIGNPAWHPSGDYILFQAEWAEHQGGSFLANPGWGFYNNLWLMTADGNQVWQLTDVLNIGPVLHPQFSPDGSKLIWAEGGSVRLADFVASPQPHLENIEKVYAGRLVLHETHGFDPTDDTRIIFSGPLELDQPMWGMDVYTLDVETADLRNLTATPDQWDEHAHYSPDGQKIAWMSSMGCDCDPSDTLDLETEVWLMDADGSNKTQLTHMSDPTSPDYLARHIVVGDLAWSPDGTKLALRVSAGPRHQIVVVELDAP